MITLRQDEQYMLDGKDGKAKQKAMELLVSYGEALGADSFVDTNNVTIIPGSIPNVEIIRKVVPSLDPDEIASRFLLDSDETVVLDKVKAFTTTNATWRDQKYPDIQLGGRAHCDMLQTMADYCKRVGMIHLATCTPYQVGNIPVRGEHCAWTESSAIAYVNSVIGARTNIEGLHSAFASAVTGKTPLWGMHLEENRAGKVKVGVEVDMEGILEWCLLGYYVAGKVGLDIPIYTNIARLPDLNRLMALCSAGISSGSIVMHHIVGVTPEAPTVEKAGGNKKNLALMTYGRDQRRVAYEQLNRSKRHDVDIVALGCPHCSLERMAVISRLLEGKKIHGNTRLFVTTNSMIKAMADMQGFTSVIVRAGGVILEDSCALSLAMDSATVFACDSAKLAHYAPGAAGLANTWFGTTEECIEAALTGTWRGELR